MTIRFPRTPVARAALLAPVFAAVLLLLWWRGPDWDAVGNAFTFVAWWWLVAALGLNLASVLARSLAWRTTVLQALPEERLAFAGIFSAFSVGLLANAVLPGRMGELARVAVLKRRLPPGHGHAATLLGTVFTHRLFDLFPAVLLVAYTLATAKIPNWAVTAILIAVGAGLVLFVFAVAGSRLQHRPLPDAAGGAVRRLLAMGRQGLSVLRSPLAATVAILYQCAGWLLQLVAVWLAMRAFGIHAPLPAAALVLLLMNVATIFPLWPGNFGLLQAAVALPLVSYGVAYPRGFAYGLGLQVVEMSVGVGVGLVFLAREGLSMASLRRMEPEEGAEASAVVQPAVESERALERASTR